MMSGMFTKLQLLGLVAVVIGAALMIGPKLPFRKALPMPLPMAATGAVFALVGCFALWKTRSQRNPFDDRIDR